jgi:hypothetical protein
MMASDSGRVSELESTRKELPCTGLRFVPAFVWRD